ncbi:MAG: CoB--CoM heterodisulfide reductase iron-sulfur subunit B family protein [Thermodesulfobacteriota bacterium]
MTMKVSYYPGCALHGTALEYDESIQALSRMLGVEMRELPDWNCCGASSAHVTDESLALSLPARNLAIAERQGMDLVIPCAACYGRVKAAEKEMLARRGTAAPKQSFRVLNLLDFIVTAGLSEKIATLKKRTLNGLKVACYYGCLLVRPPKVTGAKNHENPQEMDRLMALIGAEPVPWSYKTDCCGGSLVISRTDIVRRLTQKLFDGALRAGAEAIVVACPLCQSNLDSRQEEISREAGKRYNLPVFYFTELIGLAMGHGDAGKWFKRHFVNPAKLLAAKGLV